ncbi:MAG: dephospho-CoA kinase [Rhizobiales bacterium]|nr:dephospho-CoA kinase [Hyphomicrobiales bacterium]
MIILGLTGSIAMGKSETAKMFASLGVPVFDADAEVHKLYRKGGAAAPLIASRFPEAVKDGVVNRQTLSRLIADDPQALGDLESVVHPLERKAECVFIEAARAKGERLVVLDIPLLFETGRESDFDYTAVVSADAEEQRRRALARPGMTVEKFKRILDRQMPDAEKRKRADFIIATDTLEIASRAVAAIVEKLKANAS